MSEFEDRNGNILSGPDRRRAARVDGFSRRELRKGERIERRGTDRVDEAPEECRGCEAEFDCRYRFDRKKCGEED